MKKEAKLLLRAVGYTVAIIVMLIGGFIGTHTAYWAYQDWQWDRSFDLHRDKEYPERVDDESARDSNTMEPVVYKMTLPFCATRARIELTYLQAEIACEDGSDFQMAVGEDVASKLGVIEGITAVDLSADTVIFRQSGGYSWLALLQEAAPILLAELENH